MAIEVEDTDRSAAPASTASERPAPIGESTGYPRYVLGMLFLVYVFNFVDRQILTVVLQQIKEEFVFSDTQMGLLSGLLFAVLYSTLGIPIARLADRGNRVRIIAAALFVWSLFTAVTGQAKSFLHLAIARVGVGIGEAGCSPPAYSLISDYFPAERRATALSIYSMGIYGGVFVGFLVAGRVAEAYGWRAAFYVMGIPGIVLSLIVLMTVREPVRGAFDKSAAGSEPPPLKQAMASLLGKRSFRHMSFAAALHAFVGYGVGGFVPAFLMRSHGMSVAEVGDALSWISASGGFVGTFLGGWFADRLAKRSGDARHYLWIPGLSTLVAIPFALLAYTLDHRLAVLVLLIPTGMLGAMYLGPTMAMTQSLVGPRERALAGAILLFIINLIGLGLGPTLTGQVSDLMRGRFVAGGMDETLAIAQGLRYALCIMILVNVWSAIHYMIGARSIRADIANNERLHGG
jgi:MFS family permease